ncbi:MAG TPA: sialate O-acetylesterase [Aequorivita sp.]|nr:sialate O-acetylesterase [Aequorivita sp.]
MKKLWALFFSLLFLLACSKPKEMFVLAGQSNAGPLRDTLAYHYKNLTGKEVYIIQCAKPGSALDAKAQTKDWGNWSPNGDVLDKAFDEIDKRLSIFYPPWNKEKTIKVLIWSQGENDGEAIGKGLLTPQEYREDLKSLISAFREKYGSSLPFIIIETGRHATCKECDEGYAIVRKIQQEVATEDPNTYIGYSETEDFIERGWLKDPVHYNGEALNDIGEKVAKFIVENKIN